MDLLDSNDVVFAQSQTQTTIPIVGGYPCPRGADHTIHPHVSRFLLADGQLMDVFHVKPIYYETPEGCWRPLSEVCSHHGNRQIAIRPDRVSWIHPRFLLWLMKRQRLLGSELSFDMPGYSGVQPRHLQWADSLTAYPDPHPETTTVDGRAGRIGDASWATSHDTATATNYSSGDTGVYLYACLGSRIIQRLYFLFSTAALGTGSVVTAATVSWVCYNSGFSNGDNDGDDWINVVQSNPATNTDIVAADYNKCGSAVSNPTEGATRIDMGSITHNDSTYNTWTLDATGRGWISVTGVTKLGLREGHDCINSAAAGDNICGFYSAETSGTTSDPKLVITYTPPTPKALNVTTSPAASLGRAVNKNMTVPVTTNGEYTSGLTFTASGNYNSYTSLNNGGAGLRDGIGGTGATMFGTTLANPSWIMVDLGADVYVSSVSMMPNNGSPDGWGTTYFQGSIQWAPNNAGSPGTWTPIGTANGGTYGVYQNFTVNQTCRFIRIYHTSWTALCEFRIYATAAGVTLVKSTSKSVSVSSSPVVSKRVQALRALSVSVSSVVSRVLSPRKNLSVNSDPDITLVKQANHRLSVSSTVTKSIVRAVSKAMQLNASQTIALRRDVYKAMSVNQDPSITLGSAVYKSLSVNQDPSVSIALAIAKALDVQGASVISLDMNRQIFKALSVDATASLNILKDVAKYLSVTTQPEANITPSTVAHTYLDVQVSLEATIQKGVTKLLGVDAQTASSIQRLIDYHLNGYANSVVGMGLNLSKSMQVVVDPEVGIQRDVTKALSVDVVSTITLDRVTSFLRALGVNVAVETTIGHIIGRVLQTQTQPTVSMMRLVGLQLSTLADHVNSLGREVSRELQAVTSPEASIDRVVSYLMYLQATAQTVASVARRLPYSIQADVTSEVSVARLTLRVLQAEVASETSIDTLKLRNVTLQAEAVVETLISRVMSYALGVDVESETEVLRRVFKTFGKDVLIQTDIIKDTTKSLQASTAPVTIIYKWGRFQRVLQVAVAPVVGILRGVAHLLDAEVAAEATLSRNVDKAMQVIEMPESQLTQLVIKALQLSTQPQPRLWKFSTKTLQVNAEVATSIDKQTMLQRALGVATQPLVTLLKSSARYLQAQADAEASLKRDVNKSLQSEVGLLASMQRVVQYGLNVQLPVIPSLAKQLGKLLGVDVQSTSDISKTTNLGLSSETQPEGSIQRLLNKTMQASAESASSIGRVINKTLQAVVAPVVTISRGVSKSFGVVVSPVVRVYSMITSGIRRRIVIWYRTIIQDEDYDPD